jgi:1-acyl-sn-glycerol-3-phosphate acyltransferase
MRYPGSLLYNVIYWIGFPLSRLLFGLRVEGAENMPAEGGLIVAVNHASNADPVLVGISLPRRLCFLAKMELFRNPLFGAVLRHLGAIPLHRGAADTGALKAAAQAIGEGKALLLFPEGTRSRTGELQPGRRGVGLLALRCGVPVLPVYLGGTYKLSRRLVSRGLVVRIGRPFDAEAFRDPNIPVKERYRLIGEATMARIRELKDAGHH